MKTILVILLVAGLGVLLLIGSVIGTYNTLVNAKLEYETKWGQVENQLQRRYDLIPNLVNSVKGAMKHEQSIIDAVTDAREKYGGSVTVEDKIKNSNTLGSALSRLLVIIENYPDIKSNEQVTALMDELAGTENRIAVERMRYNESVKVYNSKVKTFPSNVLAGIFGFEEAELFAAVVDAAVTPEVEF